VDVLTVEHLAKNYENEPLLVDLSMEIHSGELLCLLGRSGSGKSTLLRIITGIETADSGRILWNGEDITNLPVHRRGFGLMFQDFALFPHLNVMENVAFGLRLQNLGEEEINRKVKAALDRVNMGEFASRKVTDLSGGEQQRVALARSLAPNPRLLLLDEPLSSLDKALRGEMQDELREQLQQSGIPAIYVTHDQEEALALSDRIALLHEGRIEQAGNASDVYARPASLWAAEFLGMTNFVAGEVVGSAPFTVQTGLGRFHPQINHSMPVGSKGTLLIKPFMAVSTSQADSMDRVTGQVESCIYQIDHYRIKLRTANTAELTFFVQAPLAMGAQVTLSLRQDALLWYGESR
jgi:ABC-type Fe3+/spermidine/putrescine transport system ATPase subunit